MESKIYMTDCGNEWGSLKERLGKYKAVWTDGNLTGAVSRKMVKTAMMGNGDVGANSGGTDSEKTYLVSKQDFWDYPSKSKLSVGGMTIREALVEFTSDLSGVGCSEISKYPLSFILKEETEEVNDIGSGVANQDNAKYYSFTVDLGKARALKKYELYHYYLEFHPYGDDTVDFSVSVSLDGKDYETIQNVRGNVANVTEFTFDKVRNVRYVKVHIVDFSSKITEISEKRIEMRFFGSSNERAEGALLEKRTFCETLDIADGTLCTDMVVGETPVNIQNWVAATDNVMITAVKNTGSVSAELECNLFVWSENTKCLLSAGVNTDGSVWAAKKSDNARQEVDEQSWLSQVVMMTKVLDVEATAQTHLNRDANLRFTVQPNQKVYIVTSIGGGGQNWNSQGCMQGVDPVIEAKEILAKYNSVDDLIALKAENDEWWKNYWLKSYLDVGDEQIHRYYYGSLYYMACTARGDKMPPGLYGIWTTTDSSNWRADYHLNYNMIAPFYGMYSANRCEFAKSLKDPLLDYMEEGMRRAKNDLSLDEDLLCENGNRGARQLAGAYINGGNYYNVRAEWSDGKDYYTFSGREDLKNGIDEAVLYPVSIIPWGITADDWYYGQVHNAGYTGMAFTAYYNYTKDAQYFEEIYPFLLANVNFYEKWCEKEVFEDGTYRYNIWSGTCETTFDFNSPCAIGTVKNILECLLDAEKDGVLKIGIGKGCYVTQEKFEKWVDMYENFADYFIFDGYHGRGINVIEGYDATEICYDKPVILSGEDGMKIMRGITNVALDFIAPGQQVGFDSDPKLREASRNSIELKEIENPQHWNQMNETPRSYLVAMRCGVDPEYVIDKFKILLNEQLCENYTIQDDTHGIEKAAAIEFVNTMLLQSDKGIIKVFPSWIGKDASFTRLRERGAFLVSSQMKKGKILDIEVTSEVGGKVTIVNPWVNVKVLDSNGNPISYTKGRTRNTNEETVTFATTAGTVYKMKEFSGTV